MSLARTTLEAERRQRKERDYCGGVNNNWPASPLHVDACALIGVVAGRASSVVLSDFASASYSVGEQQEEEEEADVEKEEEEEDDDEWRRRHADEQRRRILHRFSGLMFGDNTKVSRHTHTHCVSFCFDFL